MHFVKAEVLDGIAEESDCSSGIQHKDEHKLHE